MNRDDKRNMEIIAAVAQAKDAGDFASANKLTSVLLARWAKGSGKVVVVYEYSDSDDSFEIEGADLYYDLLAISVGGQEIFIPVPLIGDEFIGFIRTKVRLKQLPSRERHNSHRGKFVDRDGAASHLLAGLESEIEAAAWVLAPSPIELEPPSSITDVENQVMLELQFWIMSQCRNDFLINHNNIVTYYLGTLYGLLEASYRGWWPNDEGFLNLQKKFGAGEVCLALGFLVQNTQETFPEEWENYVVNMRENGETAEVRVSNIKSFEVLGITVATP